MKAIIKLLSSSTLLHDLYSNFGNDINSKEHKSDHRSAIYKLKSRHLAMILYVIAAEQVVVSGWLEYLLLVIGYRYAFDAASCTIGNQPTEGFQANPLHAILIGEGGSDTQYQICYCT